jgi:hypothetical protein
MGLQIFSFEAIAVRIEWKAQKYSRIVQCYTRRVYTEGRLVTFPFFTIHGTNLIGFKKLIACSPSERSRGFTKK